MAGVTGMEGRIDPPLLARASRVLSRRDPRLGTWIRRLGPCGLRRRGDPYTALLQAVLHQQLAGAAAAAIGRRVRVLGQGRFPRPAALLALRDEALLSAGLSRRKVATLRGVAEAFRSGRIATRRLVRMEDAQVVETLTELDGIGEWTAHMLLIFSLGRADVLPLGDYGIRKGAQRLYELSELPRGAELERIAEPWRPYRSVASWYLWRIAQATPGD
ncbi:MAG TPA: DNA-3-methyladenine glycosylase 2 family protein [Myxococcota bacterium]|nr:DNA-3-methyladenine glycosylase 2 family protein [Myxococcota bacterium]